MCTYNAAKGKAHNLLEGCWGPKTGLTEYAMGSMVGGSARGAA